MIRILEATASFPEPRSTRAFCARSLRGGRRGRRSTPDLTVAAELVESLRPRAGGGEATRAAFMAKHAIVYEELVELALTRGQIASAFEWMERSRGRALLDQLVAGGVDVLPGVAEPRRSELGGARLPREHRWPSGRPAPTPCFVRDDLEPSLLAVRTAGGAQVNGRPRQRSFAASMKRQRTKALSGDRRRAAGP